MFRGPILECGAFVLQNDAPQIRWNVNGYWGPGVLLGFALTNVRDCWFVSSPGITPTYVGPDGLEQCPEARGRVTGSPPHMWGRVRPQREPGRRERFTPTYVGPVRSAALVPTAPPVHPHVCGAGLNGLLEPITINGSPPRMWGRCGCPSSKWLGHRFTPTYVGPVDCRRRGGAAQPVHPHVCGAGSAGNCPSYIRRGSPPRMWGRCFGRCWLFAERRFTPTYVGPV